MVPECATTLIEAGISPQTATRMGFQRAVFELQLAQEDMSVTFISSEVEEMLRTCSRLIVMRDRNIVGELTGSSITQAQVMKTIAGGEQK